MDSAKELSIEFLRSHPQDAAPVLEEIAPQDAAAFLADVPDDVGGPVVELMQPLVASAVLPALTRKKAARLLMAMDVHGRSRIIRLLAEDVGAAIMDQMPKGAARQLTRVLHYPEGSVGTWMSSDVAVFERSTTVADCLAHLRSLPEKVRNQVFVIDEDKKLYGVVDLADVLAAPDDSAVEALADRGIKRVSPYARLISIVALPAWDTALSLPVVDTKGRLLGALHFHRLREGFASEQGGGSEPPMGRILIHLAEAFLVAAAGVLQTPSAKPVLSRPLAKRES
jgi:magnesium transporter